MIKALAQGMVEAYSQPLVNLIELCLRKRDHFAPNAQAFRIAALQRDQFVTRLFQHGMIDFAGGIDQFI